MHMAPWARAGLPAVAACVDADAACRSCICNVRLRQVLIRISIFVVSPPHALLGCTCPSVPNTMHACHTTTSAAVCPLACSHRSTVIPLKQCVSYWPQMQMPTFRMVNRAGEYVQQQDSSSVRQAGAAVGTCRGGVGCDVYLSVVLQAHFHPVC